MSEKDAETTSGLRSLLGYLRDFLPRFREERECPLLPRSREEFLAGLRERQRRVPLIAAMLDVLVKNDEPDIAAIGRVYLRWKESGKTDDLMVLLGQYGHQLRDFELEILQTILDLMSTNNPDAIAAAAVIGHAEGAPWVAARIGKSIEAVIATATADTNAKPKPPTRYRPTDYEFAMLLEAIAYAIEAHGEKRFDSSAAFLLGAFAEDPEWHGEEHAGFRDALHRMGDTVWGHYSDAEPDASHIMTPKQQRIWLRALFECFELHPMVAFALDPERMAGVVGYDASAGANSIDTHLRRAVRFVCSGSSSPGQQLTIFLQAATLAVNGIAKIRLPKEPDESKSA